jgi:phosphoribosyl 1,2-cyclic phosphodiesterase
LRFQPLASGSAGNATLVELASTRLLVDAGLSARALAERLRRVGLEPGALDAILLTHEHVDHARGARRLSKLHGVPVISFPETLDAMDCSHVHLAAWQPLVAGRRLALGDLVIEPFPVPHDARYTAGFVLHGEGLQVGIATDLGHATTLVVERLRRCDLVMIESNHDDRMLLDGPYPWHVKQRVQGRYGHLSNHEAAAVLRQAVGDGCRAVVLAHLSESNNRPALVRRIAGGALAQAGRTRVDLRIASADGPTPPVWM